MKNIMKTLQNKTKTLKKIMKTVTLLAVVAGWMVLGLVSNTSPGVIHPTNAAHYQQCMFSVNIFFILPFIFASLRLPHSQNH